QKRTTQRGGQRGDLHRDALGLEADLIGNEYAAARDLRDGEVDEHDAAREHLRAERNVCRGDEQAGDQRREHDREVDWRRGHCAPFSRRAIVSSNRLVRSFASASPPTVNGSATVAIFARSAIPWDG